MPYFDTVKFDTYYSGEVVSHPAEDAHQIILLTPQVWTLVFTSGRARDWGYRFSDGSWMQHQEYRDLKNKTLF